MTEPSTLSPLNGQNVNLNVGIDFSNISEVDLTKISNAKYVEPDGLIKEIKDYLCSRNQADPLWNESLALVCVSVAMGRDIFVPHIYGDIKGNLMFLFIGASSISFKSVAKDQAEELIKEYQKRQQKKVLKDNGIVNEKGNGDFLIYKIRKDAHDLATNEEKKTDFYKDEEKLLEKIKSEMKFYIIPSQFTSEALITYLCEQPEGVVFGDEFSGAYEGHKS